MRFGRIAGLARPVLCLPGGRALGRRLGKQLSQDTFGFVHELFQSSFATSVLGYRSIELLLCILELLEDFRGVSAK
jgi:hypothetical protein